MARADIGLSSNYLMNITATASTIDAPQTNIPFSSSPCAQAYAALQNALQAGDLAAARGA
jgi:hypothetical protein